MNINPANILTPKTGRLLVARPFMDDTYFKRTVILICDHNEDGTFGFILNKYMELQLNDVIPKPTVHPDSLSVGGPVETGHIYYIHKHGHRIKDSEHIIGDLYMGGAFADLIRLADAADFDPATARYFLGYTGWESGQLEAELATDSWYVAESKGIDFMSFGTNRDTIWGDTLRKMGGEFVNLANFPEDPLLN